MLPMFADLRYFGFHCHKDPLCAIKFHTLIPQVAIGWSCCEPVPSQATESDAAGGQSHEMEENGESQVSETKDVDDTIEENQEDY